MRLENMKTIIMCSLIVLIISAVGIGSIAGYMAYDAYKNPANNLEPSSTMSIDEPLPTDPNSEPPIPTLPPSDFNNMFSVLFLGYDRGPARDDKDAGRTDVMILCSINLKTNEVNLLSIPRDTKVTVKKLDSNGKATSTLTARINSAFLYGGILKHGAENSMDAVERLLQVPIDNYILLDMFSISAFSDAIGGVPVTSTVTIADAGIYKGKDYNLKGDQALRYIRDRHLPGTDGSDIMRTARQRQFVVAAAKRLKESDIVKQLDTLYKMTKYYKTNLTYQQLLSLASMLKKADIESIKTACVEGEGDGSGAWAYDPKKLAAWRDSVYKKT